MGPQSYMRSVTDRNVVMRRTPVHTASLLLFEDSFLLGYDAVVGWVLPDVSKNRSVFTFGVKLLFLNFLTYNPTIRRDTASYAQENWIFSKPLWELKTSQCYWPLASAQCHSVSFEYVKGIFKEGGDWMCGRTGEDGHGCFSPSLHSILATNSSTL
jgi:hypothetical protein